MLLEILAQIVLPVFLLIGVGVLVDRWMAVDLPLLNRLTFHVFAPAIVFLKLVDPTLDPAQLGFVAGFSLLHMLVLGLAAWAAFSRGSFRAHRPVLVMSAIFLNAGNYGFPFAQLAFGDTGVRMMAIILAVQIITNFTLGLWLVGAAGIWKATLRIPLIYAILLAMLFNALGWDIPGLLSTPLETLGSGLIPTALLALGVQLNRSRFAGQLGPLAVMVLSRLTISPLAAVGLATLLALLLPAWFTPGAPAAQALPLLVPALGLPVAVNVYILSAEYSQEPELASQAIFWSTLLSAFTLTGWLALYRP